MAYTHDVNDITPVMTANNAPSPYVASASSEYNSSYAAWKAFDHSVSTLWDAGLNVTTGWLKFDFNLGTIVRSYFMYASTGYQNYHPTAWTFEGSNDNSNWTILDSRSGISWSAEELKTFSFINETTYRYYRINVSASGSTELIICELEMFVGTTSLTPILISPQGWTGSWSHNSTTSTFTGSGAYAGRTIVATSSAAVNQTCYPGLVFDSDVTYAINTMWQVAGNQTITFNFGTGYSLKVNSYKVWNGNSGYYSNSWTLSGSNDGTNWTSLDVRAGVGLISGSVYTISSPAFYQYYKIVVSNAYNNYSTFNELEFYGDMKTPYTGGLQKIPHDTRNSNNPIELLKITDRIRIGTIDTTRHNYIGA